MIGQEKLLKHVNELIELDELPRFIIITGQSGSGKKTLANYIASLLSDYSAYYVPDIKVESIRKMIEDSYRLMNPVVYIISDVDNMSIMAKNALLKVTEEPPKKASFIMTVADMNTVLETLKSRAYVLTMYPYTSKQIIEYAHSVDVIEYDDVISDLCETPGDVDRLSDIGIKDLYDYVNKVIDNVADVSVANTFKIADNISFKQGEEGFPIDLFLRVFRMICLNEVKQGIIEQDLERELWYKVGVEVASNHLNQLSITGINTHFLFDMFLLDIRREWE